MAIARKPASNRADPEKAAEAFIQSAGRPSLERESDQTAAAFSERRRTPIMLRFNVGLLRRVDAAAKRRGISRSAWIAFKVSEALDAEDA
jgi:predicted HicB family RNase H-like nuclease